VPRCASSCSVSVSAEPRQRDLICGPASAGAAMLDVGMAAASVAPAADPPQAGSDSGCSLRLRDTSACPLPWSGFPAPATAYRRVPCVRSADDCTVT